MAICPFLFSQETPDLKQWTKMECKELKNIHTAGNSSEIWGMESESTQYLLSQYDNIWGKLYKFTANGQKATLKEISTIANVNLYNDEIYYLNNDQDMYQSCRYAGLPEKKKNHNNKHRYDWQLMIWSLNVESGAWDKGYFSDFRIESLNGQCFLLNNAHYFLSSSDSRLYQLKLTQGGEQSGTIEQVQTYELNYSPKQDTSILLLKDTLYYFSDSGFCAVTISDNSIENFLIDSVTTTDEESSIIADKNNRIWIISKIDGVIEYDITNGSATKIAEFPSNSLSKALNFTKACFYSKNYLYCITNKAVYSLNVKGSNPNPVKPRKPKKPWIGPIFPIIEGGYKFTGPAKFFNPYLSINCNGMDKIFSFEPKMPTFYEAPNAPQVAPTNSNNVFMNDKYFYIYNPKENTITCTDTQTGMSQEIACYENMPQDIIQVAVANNLFYILTESGKNHVACKKGFNLQYESTWKLDNWTPRTDASMATVNNEIYVFGGKEESSNTCLNELYVFDSTTNSSEKLEMSQDVTPRSGATLLANEDFGKLYITGGQDSSGSTVLDMWEVNTKSTTSGKADLTYLNNLPDPAKDGNNALTYDKQNDILSLLITPKKDNFSAYSNSNTLRASSGAVVYQMTNLAKPTDAPDQSGKSCGCLGIEFLFILAGVVIFCRFRNA